MPTFSILTPVYDPPAEHFRCCVASVLGQTDGDWEWILVDDCSPSPETGALLNSVAKRDSRIRVLRRVANGGIVAATNDALAAAMGDFVALLDHDDELERDALATVRRVIDAEPELDFAYSDEIVWDAELGRYLRMYKPAWSPERMRCQNYANHLSVFRRSLVEEVGGWRPGFDGAQDHDLVLRVGERARVIRHITKPLYRWNVAPGSTVGQPEAKPEAFRNGMRAVAEHCERVGIDAEVEFGPEPGVYRLNRRLNGEPLVSIVSPSHAPVFTDWRGDHDLLHDCVSSLFLPGHYANVEVLIVPDPETDTERLEGVRAIDPERIRVLPPEPRPFNFSKKINAGAARARGDYLLLLNDDVEAHDGGWLAAMLAIAQQEDVGAVGARLLFDDRSIQHGGVFMWFGPSHVGLGDRRDDPGHIGLNFVDRECVAVTGACLLTPRNVFEQVGGLWTGLPSNWNDVDYCLKVRTLGKRIVWTPQATLTHHESKSRDPEVQPYEHLRFGARWARELAEDPYFSPGILEVGPRWPSVDWR